MQATLALPFAACVLKELHRACAILVAKDYVGDELLEAGVFLDFASRPIAGMHRVEQLRQKPLHVAGETLKVTQAMKHGRGNDEHRFGLHWIRRGRFGCLGLNGHRARLLSRVGLV